MRSTRIIENLRLDTQRSLDQAKTHAERNKFGQFATPPKLALEITRQSREYLRKGVKIRFLDPAFGTGAFYSAFLQVFPRSRIESANGFEIDSQYGKAAKRLWANAALTMQITDFFSVTIPTDDQWRANLIVCNPPYVRHHHLSAQQKERMGMLTAKTVGLRVNGLSGLYCYFLIHAHNWLAEGGMGCWLIPSEFMDVNYGTVLKEYLTRKVTLLRIHRFDPAESQFDDALVSSAVVWFRKATPPADHRADFTFGGTFESPHILRRIPLSGLARTLKWTRITNGRERGGWDSGVKLSDLFNVKRGLATGANNFFILTPEKVKEYNLPTKFLIPILPSPRYIKEDVIEGDKRGNPRIENPQFLLSCNLPSDRVKEEHQSLWKYLEQGMRDGVHERYLSQHRRPWYAQEDRPPSPFLCTYMGRQDSPTGSPFRFILNASKATAANVYLFLYPKPPLAHLLARHPDLTVKVWEGLKGIPSEALVREGRVYGGGLHKIEPRELANASADSILHMVPELNALDLPFLKLL